MRNCIFTGISGSGRTELIDDLKDEIERKGKKVNTYNVAELFFTAAKELNIEITEQKVLDLDHNLLFALRKIALDKILISMKSKQADYNFIGIHAAFRWRQRLIKGIMYRDLLDLEINGFINVVDNVGKIVNNNLNNPKYKDVEAPDLAETNNWLIEEEFITELLADIFKVPMYLVGRNHNIANLADLFLTNKPKIYLSYPITQIEKDNPDLLEKVRKEILPKLEEKFILFDPLVIEDMEITSQKNDLPDFLSELSEKSINTIKTRTVERDFKFIDQSDFIVVIYLTEKNSPGVLSEIIYANNRNKPVYMVYPYTRSPFLDHYATKIFEKLEDLIEYFSSEDFKEK